MSAPPSDPSAPRTNAEYRWTPRKAHAFLDALACHGKVAAAARAVGMTRQSAYRLKERVPVIAEGWERAQALGRKARRGAGRKRRLGVRAAAGQGDTSACQVDGFGNAR